MRRIRFRKFGILLILFSLLKSPDVCVGVRARVMNRLGSGKIMDVHCQSADDDLGYFAVPDGFETDWVFSANFWGTTLFYCDVQWDDSKQHHFDAYSYERDALRCQSECIWVIANDGNLYNYNQEHGEWDLMPFQDL